MISINNEGSVTAATSSRRPIYNNKTKDAVRKRTVSHV